MEGPRLFKATVVFVGTPLKLEEIGSEVHPRGVWYSIVVYGNPLTYALMAGCRYSVLQHPAVDAMCDGT